MPLENLNLRDHPRFFDQVGHQTKYAFIKNKYFFTKSRHRQTYQNYEQPPQILQNMYFQSHFSASKINEIFLGFLTMIFKGLLCFLKMCPIYVGSVHNFGRSDDYMI